MKAVYHGSLFANDPNEPHQFDELHVPVFKDPQPQHNHQQDADSKPRATVDDGNGQQHSRANSKKAEAIYRENVVTIVFLITEQIIKFSKNCKIGGGSSNSSSSDGSTASGKESASEDSDCCLKKDITDGNNSEEVGAFNATEDNSSEGMDASDCILNMNLTTVTLEINNPSSHHSGRKSNYSNNSSEEGSRIKIRSVNMVLNVASFNSQPQQERALFYAIGETLFKLFGKQESISVGRLINSNMDVKKSSNGNNTTSSKIDQQSESSDDDELFENSMMKALSILDEESAVEEIPERMNTSCQAASPVVIDLVGRVASPYSRANVASPLSCSPSVATMASPALPDSEPIGANEQRHPKRNKKPSNNPHYSTFLQIQNQHPTFPIAVVRLISDLIDSSRNAEEDNKSTNSTISNSRSRKRKLLFRSLKDVIEDLKQMVIEPSIFLHDSQDTSAVGKLDFGTILYGRQAEIHRLLQVAKTIENQQLNIGGRLEMFSIEGYSGSGKSALVQHVGTYLSITKGWFFLQAKFDRMRQNDALSVVTSTFENYCRIIHFLKTTECLEDLKYCSKVPGALIKALGHEGIASLSHLIPSLVHVAGTKMGQLAGSREGKSSSSLASDSKMIHTASDALMSQSRLEYLLLAFAETILSLGRPILLFYDDMQWAELATLEFLSKLVKRLADHSDARKNLLYIQAFRDNEVDGTDPLHVVMSPAISHDSTNFSQIKLCGFDKKELNGVLSEALRLPCRITHPLSEIVHQKTMGNIMFVIEFMKILQDPRKKMLYYSVSKHRWRWDADSIALTSITGNVAGLLMNKLLCIEKNTLDCLIIASCFGSQVNSCVIQNLEGMKGTVNMIENLEAMVVEGLLEKAGPLFMFVHDAIQQTVYEISQENERLQLHIEIGSMLISKSSRAPIDGIEEIFALAVDQINMALQLVGDIAMIFTPSQRVTFAKLNLRAGQKDINDKSDFSSAKVHLSAAISFLPGNCWADQYNLTLQIYDEYTNVS